MEYYEILRIRAPQNILIVLFHSSLIAGRADPQRTTRPAGCVAPRVRAARSRDRCEGDAGWRAYASRQWRSQTVRSTSIALETCLLWDNTSWWSFFFPSRVKQWIADFTVNLARPPKKRLQSLYGQVRDSSGVRVAGRGWRGRRPVGRPAE